MRMPDGPSRGDHHSEMRVRDGRVWRRWWHPRKGAAGWVSDTPREGDPESLYFCELVERGAMEMPTVGTSEGSHDLPAVSLSLMLDNWPLVNALVNELCWSNGKAKGQCCLMFFIQPGAVRLLYKCSTPSLKTSVAGRDLDDVLRVFQDTLALNAIVWEPDNYVPPAKARKGKKAA